jgi:23S rRNA (adenine-N6)-dimethyltransferase
VTRAGVHPGELVLDVGAGDGAITAPLVDAGARVVAVELHPGRAAELRRRFAGNDAVKVVQADAADLWLPRRPFKVVANPPFAITAALLRRLLSPASLLVRADLVVPRYAGSRWAGPWRGRFDVRVGTAIPARAFRPPPPDGAAVLVVSRLGPGERPRSG